MIEVSYHVEKAYIPKLRKEFLEHPQVQQKKFLKQGYEYPVIENLMDKIVLNRSVPLYDGIATLKEVRNKFPDMKKYINGCLESLKKYKSMI